jgi:hypothetical protein
VARGVRRRARRRDRDRRGLPGERAGRARRRRLRPLDEPAVGGLRLEHWATAGRHGEAAARTALGADETSDPLPFFWSEQHGARLQSVGHASEWDEVDIEEGATPDRFVARYRREGRLLGVLAASEPRAIAAARKQLEADRQRA